MIGHANESNQRVMMNYLLITSLLFQPVLEKIHPMFAYYDELLCILFFMLYSTNTIRRCSIDMYVGRLTIPLSLLLVIGLLGNECIPVKQHPTAVMMDIVSNMKLYLFVLPFYKRGTDSSCSERLSNLLCCTIRIMIIVLFVCALISQFVDIGMSHDTRYGIKSFKFVFDNASGLNTYFYTYMVIFSATLFKKGRLRKHSNLIMLIALLSWVSTLRSRAFAFAAAYFTVYWFVILMRGRNRNRPFKLHWYYVIPIVALVGLIGWSSFKSYFILAKSEARYILLRGSVQIARDFFPFGTGFGTYGTNASKVYYSPVYSLYHMSNLWGVSRDAPLFIMDQYWFGILGQFGFLGTAIVLLLIIRYYEFIWKKADKNRSLQLAAITLIFTSLFASISAATYIQSSILASTYSIISLSNSIEYEKGRVIIWKMENLKASGITE